MKFEAMMEDSTHLRLIRPLCAKVGSLVILEIVEMIDHENFLDSSAALLDSAYGADEPDYSIAGTLITN